MTYNKLLRYAIKKAKTYKMEEEAVKLLLLETFPGTQTNFYLSLDKEVPSNIEKLYLEKLDKYLIHKTPIQHLLGYSYFFGHKFIVNENVLIPRNETEELVEHAIYYIEKYYDNKNIDVLDLGSGSGCIGLSLKKELPFINMTLVDISEKALNVSKENANNLEVNVKFIKSDWFSNLTEKYDVIVSNPPYIPNNEMIDEIVKKDPNVALFGGIDGLKYYETILKDIKSYIKDQGMLFFEHGFQHKEPIALLVKKYFKEANIIQYKDLYGKDRFTILTWGLL